MTDRQFQELPPSKCIRAQAGCNCLACQQTSGCGLQIAPEAAQRLLKDLVFAQWSKEACEQRVDTLKMVSLVDFFLPFLPLERQHITQLFGMRLLDKDEQLQGQERCHLTWGPDMVSFLTDKVRQAACSCGMQY